MPPESKKNIDEIIERYKQEAALKHSADGLDIIDMSELDQTQQDLADIRAQKLADLLNSKKPKNFDPVKDPGDANLVTDKVLLQLFSTEILNNAYNKETFNFTKEEQINYFKGLAAEDQDTVDDPLPEGQDPLKRILQETEYYGQLKMTANKYVTNDFSEEIRLAEGRLAKRIHRHLSDLFEQMNRQNDEANRKSLAEDTRGGVRTDEFVDDDRMFAVSNLLNFFEAEMYGKLGTVPEQPEQPDALHMAFVGKYRGVSDKEMAMANEPRISAGHDLVKDYRNQPLFPHEPCPQDIQQSWIGDCYFVATLGEIAAKRPEKIKEMMRDNNDGTATVRFYRRARAGANGFEPFYVTVDKVVSDGQAKACLWVATMERALAASGMAAAEQRLRHQGIEGGMSDKPQDSPQPTHNSPDDFTGIEGSTSFFAQQLLLGNDAQTESLIIGSGEGPLKDQDIIPIPVDREISRKEEKIRKIIADTFADGGLVNAGTLAPDKGGDHVAPCGINKKHAYTVMGIEARDIPGSDGKNHTHYFVKVRNPHGMCGRDYRVVNGKLEAFSTENLTAADKSSGIFGIAGDNNGIGYIELNHFVNEFGNIYTSKLKASSLEKQNRIALGEMSTMHAYQESFAEIVEHLDDGISFFSHNSKEYKAMKKAFENAAKHPAKNYVELIDQLSTVKGAVDRYKEHAAKIEGDPKRRAVKEEACNAFQQMLDAAYNHFEHPKAHVRALLADRMMDNFVSQDQTGYDPKEVKNVRDKIAADRDGFREAIQRTALFNEQVPHNASIAEMTNFLNKGEAFRKMKPSELDLSQSTPEHRTVGDIRKAAKAKAKT